MGSIRTERINEEVQKELANILREVKDPRVSRAFVSVTGADVSADLSVAKIYYSSLGKVSPDDVHKGIVSASGFIRRELAHRLNLRQTPELRFFRDESIAHGAHMAQIMREVASEDRRNQEQREDKEDKEDKEENE